MDKNFKRAIISLMSIVSISALFSACGNTQTADKEVTTTTNANAVTTVTTSGATTSVGDVVTTSPTSTSEDDPIVTTTTSSKTPEVETTTTTKSTTTTVATKKPVTTTTTKKATTTTAKKTTTTAKKTDKVTTTTAKKHVKLTQSDIDRLVKELQEYANSKCDFDNFFNTETEMIERISYTNTDNGSWGTPFTISTESEYMYIFIQSVSYDEILDIIKSRIDYMYSSYVSGGHIVVYQNWCPDGEAINSRGKPAWEIYLIY